jgi:hypothetical protein
MKVIEMWMMMRWCMALLVHVCVNNLSNDSDDDEWVKIARNEYIHDEYSWNNDGAWHT